MRFSRVAFFSEYWIYNVVIYSMAFYTEMWYFSKELSDSIGVITEPVISWAAPGAHIVPNISVRVCVEITSGCVLKSAWQPWRACWNNAVQFGISHLPAAANFRFLRPLSETSRKSGLVAQTCNPSTWKMYKGVVVWGSAWAILWHLVSKIKKKIEICAYLHTWKWACSLTHGTVGMARVPWGCLSRGFVGQIPATLMENGFWRWTTF